MGLTDFFARQRQKANDKEVLNASIAEHDETIVEDAPAPKKRKSRKSAEPSSQEMTKDDVSASSTKKSAKNAKTADKTIDDVDEKSTKKTRRYRAKTKVVAQANDGDDDTSTQHQSENPFHDHQDDDTDASLWKNRKKKLQQKAKKLRPPISLKQLLLSSVVVYSLLILLILLQSFWVVRQSFLYRAEYQQLNQLNEKERQLNIEWGRMLIEKQTFGSSAQIATRATMEMGMFSPSREQRVIITLPEQTSGR